VEKTTISTDDKVNQTTFFEILCLQYSLQSRAEVHKHIANGKTIIISTFHELKIICIAKFRKSCRTVLHLPIYSLSQSGAASTTSRNSSLGLNFECFLSNPTGPAKIKKIVQKKGPMKQSKFLMFLNGTLWIGFE